MDSKRKNSLLFFSAFLCLSSNCCCLLPQSSCTIAILKVGSLLLRRGQRLQEEKKERKKNHALSACLTSFTYLGSRLGVFASRLRTAPSYRRSMLQSQRMCCLFLLAGMFLVGFLIFKFCSVLWTGGKNIWRLCKDVAQLLV